MWRTLLALACCGTLGCAPKSVSDAEKKGDVPWLVADGTAEAVQALGRLSDTNQAAVEALAARPKADIGVAIAAWHGHGRGQSWATGLMRQGLIDPASSELYAAAMIRGNVHVADFLPDLETSLIKAGPSGLGSGVAGAIVSLGKTGEPAVLRRLKDGQSRAAMCRGLAAEGVNPALRALLFQQGPDSRDEPACQSMVLAIVEKSAEHFAWLVKQGEPGLLNAASKPNGLMCNRIAVLWTGVFAERSAAEYPMLAGPLSEALTRCPSYLDESVSVLLRKKPEAQAMVVAAVDPYGTTLALMRHTCGQLGVISGQHSEELTRERAADAYRHGCLKGR